jgi:preprotein translocase subunit Sec63
MENAGEHEAVNALINAVDAEFKAFKQQKLKKYLKEYYSKPVNRQRRNNYNKQYQLKLKLKRLK